MDIENSVMTTIRAANFAAIAHRSQMRKDGSTPYINHPIGVAAILTEQGQITDTDVIAAALLHDTVEDCDVSFADIEAQFGPKIWLVIEDLFKFVAYIFSIFCQLNRKGGDGRQVAAQS